MNKIIKFYIYLFTFLCVFIFATTTFAYTTSMPVNNRDIIQQGKGEKMIEQGMVLIIYEEEVDFSENVFEYVLPLIVLIMAVRFGIIMRKRI